VLLTVSVLQTVDAYRMVLKLITRGARSKCMQLP